jgi:ATP-dependent protease HslVU (ClpYQ) peptidase subunit
MSNDKKFRSATVIAVRKDNKVAMAGDGTISGTPSRGADD